MGDPRAFARNVEKLDESAIFHGLGRAPFPEDSISRGRCRQVVGASRRCLLGKVSAGSSGFPARSPGGCLGLVSEDRGPFAQYLVDLPPDFLGVCLALVSLARSPGKVSAGGRRYCSFCASSHSAITPRIMPSACSACISNHSRPLHAFAPVKRYGRILS